MTQIPEDYRIFATPSTVVTAENGKYMSVVPEYDFSQIYFCKAD